ncbi:MAG: RDD family protein [Candidatus Hodarchaeota archaeon]
MSLKFCPKCGSELEKDSRYCVSCGADLGARKEIAESTPFETIPEKKTRKISPESIEYADFVPRLVAIIIDGILIGIIGSSLSWAFFFWVPFNIFDPFGGWWAISFPFDWLIGFLYSWGLETYNNGQTVGKMAMNLRTVDENTFGPTTSSRYAINNILKPSALLILDFIIGVLKNSGDPKKRLRIMQNVSETVVIRTK